MISLGNIDSTVADLEAQRDLELSKIPTGWQPFSAKIHNIAVRKSIEEKYDGLISDAYAQEEAKNKAELELIKSGDYVPSPSSSNSNVSNSGANTGSSDTTNGSNSSMPLALKVGIAVAGLLVVGGGIYFLWPENEKPAAKPSKALSGTKNTTPKARKSRKRSPRTHARKSNSKLKITI